MYVFKFYFSYSRKFKFHTTISKISNLQQQYFNSNFLIDGKLNIQRYTIADLV